MQNFIFKKIILSVLIFFSQCLAFGQGLSSTPLTKCWEYSANISSFDYASDNVQIILPLNDGQIISIDKFGKIIWKSETGNEIISDLIMLNEKVFFLELNSKEIFLKSISTKTGIGLWQTQVGLLTENHRIQISVQNDSIAILGLDNKILLFNTEKGELEKEITAEENIVSNYITNSNSFLYYKKNNGLKKLSSIGIEEISYENKDRNKKTDISQLFSLNKNLLLVSTSGQLFLLDIISYQTVWSNRIGGNVSTISENEDSIFVSSIDNYVYRFSKRNGNINWRRRFETKALSSYLESKEILVSSLANSNITTIIEESKGRILNQVSIEPSSYFINKPLFIEDRIMLFHSKGISAFEFGTCSEEKE